jgi:hypothetical protein
MIVLEATQVILESFWDYREKFVCIVRKNGKGVDLTAGNSSFLNAQLT